MRHDRPQHDRLQSMPLWQCVALPGTLNDVFPEVADARSALAGSPAVSEAVQAVMARQALVSAAAAAAAADDAARAKYAAHYECLSALMTTLFLELPRRSQTREVF